MISATLLLVFRAEVPMLTVETQIPLALKDYAVGQSQNLSI